MVSRRVAKVAEAMRETLSQCILFELKDPRLGFVTLTRVEPSADLRTAKVYVSILGDDKTQDRSLHALRHAAGFLQAKVGDRLQTRYTPVLRFHLDQSVKKSVEISRLIDEAVGKQGVGERTADTDPEEDWEADGDAARAGEGGDGDESDPAGADDPTDDQGQAAR